MTTERAATTLAAALFVAVPVGADGAACLAPDESEQLYLAHAKLAPSDARSLPSHRVTIARTAFRARPWTRGGQAFEIEHAYDAVQIDAPGSQPQTNGHLHRLSPRYRYAGTRWAASLGPVIATSSNVGRHPREIDRSLIDWHGSLRYRAPIRPGFTGHVGVCRDDRFGSVRFSPLAGIAWRPSEQFQATLGWPDTTLLWRIGSGWGVRASASPAGGHWTVYDNDLVRRTRFSAEGWRLTISVGFEPSPGSRLRLSVGQDVRRSFAYQLDDGNAFASDFDRAYTLGVALQWLRR